MSEQVTALWRRINEINLELAAVSSASAANIVSAGDRIMGEPLGARLRRDSKWRCEVVLSHEERAAELRRELVELRAKLPPEGMRSGQRLVLYRGLGEMILREDPEPEYSEVNIPRDEWNWSEP
jgi:hypothetical protein